MSAWWNKTHDELAIMARIHSLPFNTKCRVQFSAALTPFGPMWGQTPMKRSETKTV